MTLRTRRAAAAEKEVAQESKRVPAYNFTSSDGSVPSDSEDEDMPSRVFREKAGAIREDISAHFEERVTELLGEVERIMKVKRNSGSHSARKSKRTSGRKSDNRQFAFKDKVFVPRESFLTEMLTVNHFQTLYNIFIAVLVVFGLQSMATSYFEKGRIIDLSMFAWNFNYCGQALLIVLGMFAQVIMTMPFLKAWAYSRSIPNWIWLGLYIAYAIAIWVWPATYFFVYEFPPASSLIILCEQSRLFMKMHSYVRENAPRILSVKAQQDWSDAEIDAIFPSFDKLLYFLFCPTLLYRDQYPRTQSIRWNSVFINFGQCVAILFYVNFIFERFCLPLTKGFGLEKTSVQLIILNVFQAMLPGTLLLMLCFFAILHSWLNTWAELLCFADRQFYKDWWNCRTFAQYYRNWNGVVHDWLYAYVFTDIRRLGFGKPFSMLFVFVFSAIIHEYILALAFRFFYPVLLLMFGGVGVGFIYLTKDGASGVWNLFMWLMLMFGNGMLMILYGHEWYARANIYPDATFSEWNDMLYPKSWMFYETLSKS
eukprot:Nk52_evm26s343 gene=Nk52_evmTU26s343